MKAYKVVSQSKPGVFWSVCAVAKVRYRIGQVTKPKRGSNPFLFVFTNLKSARDFKREEQVGRRQWTILRVKAINPDTQKKTCDGKPYLLADRAYLPLGTMFCDSVEVLSEV